MTEPGTVSWRQLWVETEALVGARTVARWLCEEACGLEGAEFLAELDRPATESMVHHLDAMAARAGAGEPVQYVLGHWSFRHLDLMVDRRVLIPRPETEQLVDLALQRARSLPHWPELVCVDLGTGSGAIGLSLVAELPLLGSFAGSPVGPTVWCTDVSADALDVARANAAGVGRKAVNARFALGSWFDALPPDLRGRIDLIVANPPYIADDDPEVEASVGMWEPPGALFSGDDGLDAIRVLAAQGVDWLAPVGWLLVEIGHRQGAQVARLLRSHGWTDVSIEVDLAGCDRFAVASAPR